RREPGRDPGARDARSGSAPPHGSGVFGAARDRRERGYGGPTVAGGSLTGTGHQHAGLMEAVCRGPHEEHSGPRDIITNESVPNPVVASKMSIIKTGGESALRGAKGG